MITNGGITGYIVSFGRLVDGLTTNVSRESNDRTFTVNSGITANTMYVIVVHAINDHGIGIPSEQAFFTTDTFSSEFSILSIYKYMCSSHPPLPLPLPPPPPLPHLPSSPPPPPFPHLPSSPPPLPFSFLPILLLFLFLNILIPLFIQIIFLSSHPLS